MKVFNKKGLSALAAVAILAAACGGSTASTAGKTLTIGISFPLNGSSLASAGPARDGALLAIKEASIEGYTLKAKVLDHAKEGAHNPDQAAADMLTFVGDESVVAVVGPFNSASARAQIPVSSEAGLLQCSPSNTNPTLTKGADGVALRGGRAVNYVRVATTDDLQGPAVAVYAKKNGAAKIYILDSTDAYGKGVADAFEAQFIADGGTVVGRTGLPTGTTDFSAVATAAKAAGADSIFYGGVTSDGAPLFRNALAQAGIGALPFYGAASMTARARVRTLQSPVQTLRTAMHHRLQSRTFLARQISTPSSRLSSARMPRVTPTLATPALRSWSRESRLPLQVAM